MTDLAKRYEGCYLNINMNELGLHTSHRLKKLQTTEKIDLIQATFLLLDYDKLLYMLGGGGVRRLARPTQDGRLNIIISRGRR
jgi:hypothetical protein